MPPYNWKTELCKLSPKISKALCPRQSTGGTNSVNTPIGTAQGTSDNAGATRFAVKYASASRWQPSTVSTTWELPNGSSDVTALPVPCVQSDDNGNTIGTEDCLSMILYVPASLPANAPTFTWIHGGSFVSGSATGPGLDGSKLAAATQSIVAVIQYRLGALGFLQPNGGYNLAVKDVMNALAFLQVVVPSFGGSSSKITIAGQSAGANMVRALLAVPSASMLFQSAALHSDPMDFGFLSPNVHQEVLGNFTQSLNCSTTDTSCLNSLSLDAIMSAQNDLLDAAANNELDPAAGASEPIRPVRDGQLITNPLDLTASFPQQSKPIIVSTVRNEAGPTIYGGFPDSVDTSLYEQLVQFTFGSPRTSRILNTAVYAVSPAVNGVDPDQRPQLEELGTDQIWRCATWTFARNWVGAGGKAYVGEYLVGATYPGNDEVPFCTAGGSVCHQDDIEILFGTVQNPTSAQSALVTEIQARYNSFLHTGSPNANGFATWSVAGTDNVNAINLGASGLATVGACNTSYWGNFVQYDYQVFNL
ncbi:alpha/beta-hydrolase [Dichomitus squalens]|uniref:Carboxylic ester hydrolase n=1 Tax=Dichomitus squalens TaxID=114155 RepID=A0A4Q9QCW9_9APHY|nr:alpha/beta-hydrolase [Dichomitus squalens LYAD-421 SS1]EJF66136.1 alpha/beta-hydrolase [Dichomitus squalens LYAD-421 SS1]TBU35655.1 alpha/beta-hydrolase [Dichomitus squalens]TBU42078.1 alpha/beta-hydrolase [Dichomitus squalens]TBU65505.1 alpha/beta-hydrolase [Dichomitus squalens]